MWSLQGCVAGIFGVKSTECRQRRRDSESGRSRKSKRSSEVSLVREREFGPESLSCWRHCRRFLETFSLSTHTEDRCPLDQQKSLSERRRAQPLHLSGLRVRRESLKLAVRRSPSSRRRRPSLDTSSSLHATPSSTHSAADKREPEDKRDVNIRFQPLGSSWSVNNSFLPKPDWVRANPQHVQACLWKAMGARVSADLIILIAFLTII